MLVYKNIDYLEFKKEKTLEELQQLNKTTKPNIEIFKRDVYFANGETLTTKKKEKTNRVIKIKKFQLKVLKWLRLVEPEKIYSVLETEKQKLCHKCETSLKDGDLSCDNDLMQFVFCDMMNKSLKVVN